jgi:hypothetical protein
LLDPLEAIARLGGPIAPHHRLQPDVARFGDQHGAQARDQIVDPGCALAEVGEVIEEARPALHLQDRVG